MSSKQRPTDETYAELQQAYDHFNQSLFEGTLPPCLITLQREKRTYGYFSSKRFVNRLGNRSDEIAMNPAYFAVRSIPETLSTLVHEMVHLWQAHFGDPGRRTYHNKEWADKIESLGLMPSSTGAPGGQRTGEMVSHYIVAGGRFEAACQALLTQAFSISWYDRFPPREPETLIYTPKADIYASEDDLPVDTALKAFLSVENYTVDIPTGVHLPTQEEQGKNFGNRDRYSCPSCGINVWGKPQLNIRCGECDVRLEVTIACEYRPYLRKKIG